MKIISIIIFGFLSVYYLSCNNNSTSNKDSLGDLIFPDLVSPDSFYCNKLLLHNSSQPLDYKIDRFSLKEITLDKDILYMSISYGGGCEEHDFALFAYNYFMESYPIQVGVLLSHDSHGDTCKMLFNKTLCYDLTPLKDEYIRLYSTDKGAITLNVLLSNNETQKIIYKF